MEVVYVVVGIIIGFVVSSIIRRKHPVGFLRIDKSDPDGPYLFLELKKSVMVTIRGVTWTSWAFAFIVIERFFENPSCTRPREKLAKSPKRRKQPYSMLGKCCLILGGSTAPVPI